MGIVNSLLKELMNVEGPGRSFPPLAQSGSQHITYTPIAVTASNDIAPSKKTAVKKPTPNKVEATTKTVTEAIDKNPLNFELTSNQLVRGIILAEIIGKPVSKRNGFGSSGSYTNR